VEVEVTENMTSVSPETSAELAELFRRTARRLHRGTREALAPLGLSGSQARLVRLLAHGPLRMSVIAERLAVVARTVTDVVDGAEVAGLVARRDDPTDRRSTLVELTPSGRRLLDQLDAARRQSAARVFGVLTEAKRGQLLALLHEVGESDERGNEPADTAVATPDSTEAAR
jgi:DNA-binding MarR family transcriptional regulator